VSLVPRSLPLAPARCLPRLLFVPDDGDNVSLVPRSLPLAPACCLSRLLFVPDNGDKVSHQKYSELVPRRPYPSRRRLLLLLLLLSCSQFRTFVTYMCLEMYQEFSATFIMLTRQTRFLMWHVSCRTDLCMAGSVFSSMLLLLMQHDMRNLTRFTSLYVGSSIVLLSAR
jgi:hypothetical protein